MKKLSILLMLLMALAMGSHRVFSQSVTVVLTPGWNWISCPMMDTLDFETALGSFTPAAGDIIKSRWGQATYRNGQWMGGISQFYPGYGYHYMSNRTMPVFLTFNAQQPAPQVIVTTAEPTDITANSTTCGGNVASSDGDYVPVTVRGICWSTSPNPTFNDNYVEAGNGLGSFNISMTDLTPDTEYYLRAYAVTQNGTTYGNEVSFTTRDGIPVVSTDSITNIGGAVATCWGTVVNDGGMNVIARGVCWSTEHGPTLNDSYTTNESGVGIFASIMTDLSLNTTYYVRAYASTNQATTYGEELSFTTLEVGCYDYVDLGLPSGILWATCNIGAETSEDYGDYFAWGETQPKDWYDWSTYSFCNNGDQYQLTKYCNNSNYGFNGFTDNLTTLLSDDDAATVIWGADWRMPTNEDWYELQQNTTHTWTTHNGVNGMRFIGSNGNSIFLPAADLRDGNSGNNNSNFGYYWSSSLHNKSYLAIRFHIQYNGVCGRIDEWRYRGLSVRAVRSSAKN